MFKALLKQESPLGGMLIVVLLHLVWLIFTPAQSIDPGEHAGFIGHWMCAFLGNRANYILAFCGCFQTYLFFRILYLQTTSTSKDTIFAFSFGICHLLLLCTGVGRIALLSLPLVLLSIYNLKRTYLLSRGKDAWNMGLWIGLCFLMYKPSVWLLASMLIGTLVITAFNIKLLVLFLMGSLFPTYIAGGVVFLLDAEKTFYESLLLATPEPGFLILFDRYQIVAFAIMTLLILSMWANGRESRQIDPQYGVYSGFFGLVLILMVPVLWLFPGVPNVCLPFLIPSLAYFNGRLIKSIGKDTMFEAIIFIEIALVLLFQFKDWLTPRVMQAIDTIL